MKNGSDLNKRNFSLEIPQKVSFYNIVSEIGTFITYTKVIWIFAAKINIRMYRCNFFTIFGAKIQIFEEIQDALI